MNIKLSDHFSYVSLLRFTFPSIVMIIFTSIYSVIDGIFVAKLVGATSFAALNMVWPFIMILGSLGFMLGSGGSALVAKMLGEGRKTEAEKSFSMLVYAVIVLGFIFGVSGVLLIEYVLQLFDINEALLKECVVYADILLPAVPMLMLQVLFQSFMVAAERPKLGLTVTIIAGVVNFILDAVFIIVFKWGLSGAAFATAVSQVIGGILPLIYFMSPNKSLLHLRKTGLYMPVLVKAFTNGASEFVSNISASVVGIIYNYQLLKIIGEGGVIAYGIISYVNFIFLAIFLGYAVGSNPIVSYHYGAGNKDEMRNLWQKSLILIVVASIGLTFLAEVSAYWIADVFVGYDEELVNMTARGFHIYAVSFLLAGFNIYAAAFFTALNNGFISAFISCCRTLIFECLSVIILPIFWGLTGIWFAIVVAESLAFIVSFSCFAKFKRRYGY